MTASRSRSLSFEIFNSGFVCLLARQANSYVKFSIMKIDRRGFLAASSSALVLARSELSRAAHVQPSETSGPLKIEGREIAVYTTADKTDYRLSPTETLVFKPLGQPLETQICVFVDPA